MACTTMQHAAPAMPPGCQFRILIASGAIDTSYADGEVVVKSLDIAIVGGSIAGGSATILLTRAGHNVHRTHLDLTATSPASRPLTPPNEWEYSHPRE